MDQVIGTCSICGGDVVGHVGVWMAIIPPPPARCTRCGAQEASRTRPVILMAPAPVAPVESWTSDVVEVKK